MRLVLASASPRRAELLSAAGFSFETRAVRVDERVRPGEDAAGYVRRLAAEKSAQALAGLARSQEAPPIASETRLADGARLAGGARVAGEARGAGEPGEDVIVVGADTVVVVEGDVLGKPSDDRDAVAMLTRLSGRNHEVMTGVSVRRGSRELGRVEISRVRFSALTPADIAWYVATGEGRDKAGGYAVQGLGARFVTWLEGSRSNVIGLPMALVRELLAALAEVPGRDHHGDGT